MELILEQTKRLVETRISRLSELMGWLDYLIKDELPPYDKQLLLKRNINAKEVLEYVYTLTHAKTPLTKEFWQINLKKYAEQHHLKLGDVLWPIRVAISGKSVALPLYESMELLSRITIQERVKEAINALK